MSQILERVIADQQAEIDKLNVVIDKCAHDIERKHNDLVSAFTRHGELFEHVGRFIDTRVPQPTEPKDWERYHSLKHEARMQFQDAGWCFGCESFICECDHD